MKKLLACLLVALCLSCCVLPAYADLIWEPRPGFGAPAADTEAPALEPEEQTADTGAEDAELAEASDSAAADAETQTAAPTSGPDVLPAVLLTACGMIAAALGLSLLRASRSSVSHIKRKESLV